MLTLVLLLGVVKSVHSLLIVVDLFQNSLCHPCFLAADCIIPRITYLYSLISARVICK